MTGIILDHSDRNILFCNNITWNFKGISLVNSSWNEIHDNIFANESYGIYVDIDSNNNDIQDNIFMGCETEIYYEPDGEEPLIEPEVGICGATVTLILAFLFAGTEFGSISSAFSISSKPFCPFCWRASPR